MNESLLERALTASNRARMATIRKHVADLWSVGDVIHPYFTLHGPQHLEQVEQFAADVLAADHRPVKQILDESQLFQLLAAVWLHDIGMIVPPDNAEKAQAQTAQMEVGNWIREVHHLRSETYVRQKVQLLGLTAHEAAVIGSICRGHRRENLMDETYFPSTGLDTRLLASVLRIADELDISNVRVPEAAMGIHWNSMDAAAQWHWVKHCCVAQPRHLHDEQKDGQAIFTLRYTYVLLLPDVAFEKPFVDRVLLPIRQTLREEYVGTILYSHGLAIAPDRFHFTTLSGDPNSETKLQPSIRKRLEAVFGTNIATSENLSKTRQQMVGTLSKPALDILEERHYRVVHALDICGLSRDVFDDTVSQWWSLMDSADSAKERERELRKMQEYIHSKQWRSDAAISVSYLKKQDRYLVNMLSDMADMTWRLFTLAKGVTSERCLQFAHLRERLESPELSALAAHYVGNEYDISVRHIASEILSLIAAKTHDANRECALGLSRDHDKVLRANSVRMLQFAPGPGPLTRLAEMSECEIEGNIRENAWLALTQRVADFNGPTTFSNVSLRVLILGDGDGARYFFDDLVMRGAAARIAINDADASNEIRIWQPQVILCILGTDSKTGFRPFPEEHVLQMLSTAKQVVKSCQAVIVSGTTAEREPQLLALLEMGVAYLQMPVTASRVANTIEKLTTCKP